MALEVEEDVALVDSGIRLKPWRRPGPRSRDNLEYRRASGCSREIPQRRWLVSRARLSSLTFATASRAGELDHRRNARPDAARSGDECWRVDRESWLRHSLSHSRELADLAVTARFGWVALLVLLSSTEAGGAAGASRAELLETSVSSRRASISASAWARRAQGGDGVGVEAQLQHVAGLLRSGQLRVDRLVAREAVSASTRTRKSAMPRMPSCTKGIW